MVLPGAFAYLRGLWYKLKFRLSGRDIRIGPFFRVYGKMDVQGPGMIRIGRNCLILGKTLRPVSLVTWRKEAEIRIGDSVGLNGTVVNCYQKVEIGDLCNFADAYIIDSSAHLLSADRRSRPIEDVPRAPVRIERNVWISVQVVVLKGVTIGKNSVIGACSLVRRDVPPDVLAAGNPIETLRRIPESQPDAGG